MGRRRATVSGLHQLHHGVSHLLLPHRGGIFRIWTGRPARASGSGIPASRRDHGYIHGKNVRPTIKDRYRMWLTHKLASWIDQFGMPGWRGVRSLHHVVSGRDRSDRGTGQPDFDRRSPRPPSRQSDRVKRRAATGHRRHDDRVQPFADSPGGDRRQTPGDRGHLHVSPSVRRSGSQPLVPICGGAVQHGVCVRRG
ncbi:MAG: hypothetical protein KatS3mg082_0600 [Nitrospiraceae bacterium]|nr:MAG: hypothetical protein KatS3mg082_0600 [Nitrospiraceae bacterium]